MKTVLSGHQCGDDEDGALVTEDGFADARDASCDGKAGVPFEGSHHRTGVTHRNQ